MKAKILVLICIIALVGATNGFAQLNDVIRVNIPFQFTVGTAVLPAGVYDFSKNKMDTAIYVRSAKKDGPGSDALVMTRLAGNIGASQKQYVVFDKVGETYTLSELWLPGADGYLINIAKETHTHKIISPA
jgi:hypothetical protein